MKSFLMLCVIAAGFKFLGCGEGEPFENCCGEGSSDSMDTTTPPPTCSTVGTGLQQCQIGTSCETSQDCVVGAVCDYRGTCVATGTVTPPPTGSGNNQPARSFSAASDSSLGYYKTGPGLDTSTAQSLGRVCIAGGEWINQNVGTASATTLVGNYVGVIACRRGNLSDCNPSRDRPTLDLSFWGANPLLQPGCRVEPNCQGIPYVLCY